MNENVFTKIREYGNSMYIHECEEIPHHKLKKKNIYNHCKPKLDDICNYFLHKHKEFNMHRLYKKL